MIPRQYVDKRFFHSRQGGTARPELQPPATGRVVWMAELPQPIKAGVPKTKTRAKARYLKRKKLRRKARKSSAPQISGVASHSGSGSDGDSEHHDDQQYGVVDDSEDDEDGIGEERVITSEHPVQSSRKRRKVIEKVLDSDMGVPGEIHNSENEEIPRIQKPPAVPTGSLPLFPLPTAPIAPPKAALAVQGIDKALVHAEVIEPDTVTPVSIAEQDPYDSGLSLKTRRRLLDLGINELFSVQTTLLPFLIRHSRLLYTPYSVPHDVCVSAPTGSGKTLAYVLPILEVLSNRIVTRLRALIVLPTRDLVTQVRETFEAVGKSRGLKIGTATGQHSFTHEQAQLVSETDPRLLGGSSKVDVLICTPGRLIDHLTGTPNFTLQHLRFLVIDEADRLLSQSFQDWLAQVLSAIHWRPSENDFLSSKSSLEDTHLPQNCDSLAPACLDFAHRGYSQVDVDESRLFSCQKLLFSATLTRDPGRLAALGLRDPKYFVVRRQTESGSDGAPSHLIAEQFAMPTTLTEHMVICEPSQKPLTLLHLLHNCDIRNALVFTKSSESTARLVFLLESFEELRATKCTRIAARAYSSDLAASERKMILEKFKAREIDVLICSDLISRGIDISHVSHVVSYDAPVDIRKYVHRVGRTARAGRVGDAWTLVEEQEARYFKTMLREHDHLHRVKRMKIPQGEIQPLLDNYQAALHKLKDAYGR